MNVAPIPEDYPTITPYLVVDDVEQMLAFATQALGGEVTERMEAPECGVMHAEVRIGTSMLMMGPARPDAAPMPAMLYMFVENCDDAYARALDAGATSHQEPSDMPYGDRTGAIKDPCGNLWYLATRQENLTPEEIAERMRAQGPHA